MKPEVISSGELELEVYPSIGGSIGRFSAFGQDIFRHPKSGEAAKNEPGLMSAFPMVPYCNRIDKGRFLFNGQQIQLEKNFDKQSNSIHGIGWKREWFVQFSSRDNLRIFYEHDGNDWPWRFSCEQHFRLEPDRLFYELSIVNLDSSEMPVGLGLHPFFPASGQARVRGLFNGFWNCDDQGLPYRFSLIDEPDPLSGNLTMAEVELDHIYVGSRSDVKVSWDNRPYALTILSPDHAYAHVVYSPAQKDFFCIEPVSHLPNVINMGRSFGSMNRLKPAESFSLRIVFIVSEE